MNKRKFIVFLFIVCAFGFGFKGCSKKSGSNSAPKMTVYCNSEQQSAPDAVKICSKSGVSEELVKASNEELQKLIVDVAGRNYTRGTTPSEYTIFISDTCNLSPESKTRSFLVDGGSAYDGSSFDYYNPKGANVKDGASQIYAAELVIVDGLNNPTNSYIVCNTQSLDAEYRNASRYGAEHIILFWNDTAEFQRTAIHNEFGHPIIPLTTTNKSDGRSMDSLTKPTDVTDFAVQVEIQK